MQNIRFFWLLSLIVYPVLSPFSYGGQALASSDPENACIQKLVNEMKKTVPFNNINMGALEKISGVGQNTVKSQPFSIKNHDQFMEAVNTPIPKALSDLAKYPNEVGSIDDKYKTEGGRIYKASRNNAGAVIGNSTPKDLGIEIDGVPQKITGYYLDNRYVTFGRESGFLFYFPSRSPAAAPDSIFPQGAPLDDMREYLLYTQHLSPAAGGDFVGCGITKVVPSPGYSLSSDGTNATPIRWEYYGSTRARETDVNTNLLSGGDFRKFYVRFTVNDRRDAEKRLLRFHTLALSYDNKSGFFNEFETGKVFEANANETKNVADGFIALREAFYEKLETNPKTSYLRVIGGSGVRPNICTNAGGTVETDGGDKFCKLEGDECPNGWSQYEDWETDTHIGCSHPSLAQAPSVQDSLFASVLSTEALAQNNTEESEFEEFGLSLVEDVPYDLVKAVKTIEDEELQLILLSAIAPGYGNNRWNLDTLPEEEKGDFFKAYEEYPLTFQQKIENVQYIIDNAPDVRKLTADQLQYKDIAFGEAVIPIPDRRVRAVAAEAPLDSYAQRLEAEKTEAIRNASETGESLQSIEDDFANKTFALFAMENALKDSKIEYLNLLTQKDANRISEDEFNESVRGLVNEFETAAKVGTGSGFIGEEDLRQMTQQIYATPVVGVNANTKTTEATTVKSVSWKYYALSFFLFITALFLLFIGINLLKKKNN